MILDKDDPTVIKQRSTAHVLVPTFDYETLCDGAEPCKFKGERKNVIFASTAMRLGGSAAPDKFRLYYGGGDGNVGTATIKVSKVSN